MTTDMDSPADAGATRPTLTKVTANFIPQAMAALAEASKREQLSRTDILNRAVQVYNVVSQLAREGDSDSGLTVLRPDGVAERIWFL